MTIMNDDYERGLLDARREYAKVWTEVTRNSIAALDFTPDRLRAELGSRWLERRCLADGTAPAVGQRVITIREVAEQWGMPHAHDDRVHVITGLLGDDCHLVECGPEQIGVGMLRLAPEGSEVTCAACRDWAVDSDRRRRDVQVFRETQFKVAELDKRAVDAEQRVKDVEVERDEALAEVARLKQLIDTELVHEDKWLVAAADASELSEKLEQAEAEATKQAEGHQRHVEFLGGIEADLRRSLSEARAMLDELDRRLVERQRERDEARVEIFNLRARVRVETEDVERALDES